MRDLWGDQGRLSGNQTRLGIVLGLALAFSGCASLKSESDAEYTTLPGEDLASLENARKLNSKGLRAFEGGHFDKAEKHFQDALLGSPNFGPAHNNLGHVFLARHQLYLAAWEFELAANLMPERIEPLLNQGLVYELAGRNDRAMEFYDLAYSMRPTSPEAIGNLARVQIKQDGDSVEIHHLLRELVLYDSRPDWIHWAEELLATRYGLGGVECWDCVVDERGSDTTRETPIAPTPSQEDPELLPMPLTPAPGSLGPGEGESLPLRRSQSIEKSIPSAPSSRLRHDESASGLAPTADRSSPAAASFDEIIRVEREPE